MRYILAKLGIGRWVWLQDHDGETNIRLARTNPWGLWTAQRRSWRCVVLNQDGTTSGIAYVVRWKQIPSLWSKKTEEKK